jgi:hypothetical protein
MLDLINALKQTRPSLNMASKLSSSTKQNIYSVISKKVGKNKMKFGLGKIARLIPLVAKALAIP